MRKQSGSSIAELPVSIFLLFLALLFPLADMATIALRTTTVFSAARNAAHYAGRALTFSTSTGTNPANISGLSAKATAVQQAMATNSASLAGVEIAPTDVQVYIIGKPLKPNVQPIRQTTPLAQVDLQSYQYQIEVIVTGRVHPLVTLSSSIMGNIAGISAPVVVTSSCREFCEHPNGLTI